MRSKLSQRWSTTRILLLLLNAVATVMTVLTGLQENPIVAAVTGQYAYFRERLLTESINYDIAEAQQYKIESLPTPAELAAYTIASVPRRDTYSFGSDRSICTRINTISAPVLLSNFDDFWGKATRRIQIYMFSISTPHCDVLTVNFPWRDQCVAENGGNATRCHLYVVTNFDTLRLNKTIRAGSMDDFGTSGVPFLRCIGRPLQAFAFKSDLLAHQTYWSGGSWHVTIQTSDCRGTPVAQTPDRKYTLFQAQSVDDRANMVVLLPPDGWFAVIVRWLHSIVTIVLVAHSILLALFHTRVVHYLPAGVRFTKRHRWFRFAVPFMPLVSYLSNNDLAVIHFKGSMLLGSDVWMAHWLYIWLSMLDSVVNLKGAYVALQLATSLLVKNATIESFVFMCGAVTKITWIMCLVQTLIRIGVKIFARCLRSARLIRSTTRERIEWNVDGASMFLGFRVFYVVLCIIILVVLKVKGSPSFMERATPYRVGAFGGVIEITHFWGSELACDVVSLLAILTVVTQPIGLALLCTKYQLVANNSLMRYLQKRYIVSGWDGLLAATMLGLDPGDPDFVIDGRGFSKLSLGSLLQVLYLSGPSGFVHLAGDYIFHDGGFTKDPVKFTYPVQKALSMGLFQTINGSSDLSFPTNATDGARPTTKYSVQPEGAGPAAAIGKRSIFERRLMVVSEGYLGKLLLVDLEQPGQLKTNVENGQREFEVVDALTTMSILDIKWLLGSEKKIRVR